MGFILRLVIGLGIAGLGAAIVIKTNMVIDWFGSVDWAEQKLGGGGTNLFYKAIGLLLVFIGFLVATNLWDSFLQSTLGSLLPTPS